ncbi:MAG: GGDEF domain-containing protein [Lachnospiraceae bacterium]|nr:GGDEF domain-containing protein [Lachnospiraceae bacterium]
MMRVTSFLMVHRPERILCYLPEMSDDILQNISDGKCPEQLKVYQDAYGTYDVAGFFVLPKELQKQTGHATVVGIECKKNVFDFSTNPSVATIVLPANDIIIQSLAFEKVLTADIFPEMIQYVKEQKNDMSHKYQFIDDGLSIVFPGEDKLRIISEIKWKEEAKRFRADSVETYTKEELFQKAFREPITGYYNWAWISERIRSYYLDGIEEYCFVHFDIKDFKMINELFSHSIADAHLRRVTEAIERHKDWIYFGARCDNDNFALMIKDMPEAEIEEKLYSFFDEISELKESPGYNIYYRCGVACMRTAMNTGEIVADCAKLAQAFGQGINVTEVNFYNNQIYDNLLWGKQLKAYLNTAIEQDEFLVYLQPKMDIYKEKVVGAEALVRWYYKHKEFMTPYRFISYLELDDSIIKVDKLVLKKVCEKLKEWKEQGYQLCPVSVNLSRKHMEINNLAEKLAEIVDEYGIDHSYIEFELTESAAYENQAYMISVLVDLKKHGFQISMDDFGTGYSSFALLKEMPLDTLKIDKSFVDLISATKDSQKIQVILRHIISMAKELGVHCIAEGAEEYDQVLTLKALGCDTVQGYFYSKPISTEDFEEKYLK